MRVGRIVTARYFSSTCPPQENLLQRYDEQGIAILTLNRANKKNALNLALLGELFRELDSISHADQIRCVIVKGNGNVFSSGHDLQEIHAASKEQVKNVFLTCEQVMFKLANLPQPTISVVNGLATAAGLQLAVTCDFTFASETSSFSTPGVDIGLFCSTPAVALARSGCDQRLFRDMLFTGRRVHAPEAYSKGLISHLAKDPEEAALKFAQTLVSKSQSALRLGKRVLKEQTRQSDLKKAYEIATQGMIENCEFYDAREGREAFIGKRAPLWRHE